MARAIAEQSGKLRTVQKNTAVVGCGHWGRNHVRNFAELGALHTTCDSNPETLSELAATYPEANRQATFEAVLSNAQIEGIVIAAPVALHYSMAKQALEAGKDVLVEKPLALEVSQGKELVDLAEQKDRILMVGHLLEYHPAVTKLKELIDSGELGKINYIYSSRLNLGRFRTEENILWSFAPHDIGIILLLLEEMPSVVSAHGGNYLNRDIADITVTNMSFPSGAKAHIFVSWLHPYKEQKLIVVADKRMVVLDDVSPDNKLLLYEHQVGWGERVPVPSLRDARPIEFTMAEPLRIECQHFLDCMMSRRQPKTDGRSGLRVLEVLDASQTSLQQHGNVISLANTSYFVHPSSLVEEPCAIGEGTKIWHFCHVMPNTAIGKRCSLGQNTFVGENVTIGSNVRIQNNVSVFDGVTLEDDVFCGPSCVFTNVSFPRSRIPQRGDYTRTLVKRGASIGANVTIVCGHTIGRYSFIGAGAVVTKDVPDYALVYGNPAIVKGWVCECGARLDFGQSQQAQCSACGEEYQKHDTGQEHKVARV